MKKKKEKKKRSLARKISNVFIAAFIGLIVLFLLLIGISQTSTFRNYVKEQITETVNTSINGKLYIGSIEGTLLSTLSIKNISITDSSDKTIFYSGEMEVRVSLPRLLTRKIYFKEIKILEAQLNLIEDENGEFNIATLTQSSPPDTLVANEKTDENGFGFPFLIQVNSLKFENLYFVKKAHQFIGENNIYKNINFDDLVIDDLDITASAIADLNNNNYSLVVKNMSFTPNVYRFDLETLSGIFVYQDKNAIIKNFKLNSDNSRINLDAKVSKVDFFNDFNLEKLRSAPVNLKLSLDPFNFDDLASFIPETELLKYKVNLFLQASGNYGNLNVNNLDLEIEKSKLYLTGNVKNLHKPEDLYLDVNINNSTVEYDDVVKLLPDIGLPNYKNLIISELNTVFKGEPTNFSAIVNAKSNQGSFNADVSMNLKATPVVYDAKFKTEKLNLSPILGLKSIINSNGKVSGRGFTPVDLNSKIKLTLNNSQIQQFNIEKLDFDGTATKKQIELNLSTITNKSELDVVGNVDFTEPNLPSYNLKGQINDLNLASVTEDSLYQSDLNFSFDAVGKSFSLDSLQGRFNVSLDSSVYQGKDLSDANVVLSVSKDSSNRFISLTSDFVDFNITGNFSLANALDVVSYQSKVLSNAVSAKIEEFNPLYKEDTTKVKMEIPEEVISNDLDFQYDFVFKDFSLIAVLLDEQKLDIAGSGEGSISNNRDAFEIETDFIIDYFLKVNAEVIYLSNLESEFRLSRNNNSVEFKDIFGSLSINCERYYSESDINNIEADLIFNESNLIFNTAANINNQIDLSSSGKLLMTPREQEVTLDDLSILYNNIEFKNLRPIKALLKIGQSLDIEDFSLYHNNAAAHLYGIVNNDGTQDLTIDLNNISGALLSKLVWNSENELFNAELNLDGDLGGTFDNPVMNFDLAIDSISYGESNFGSLIGNFDYEKRNFKVDASFLDPSEEEGKPKLTLTGNIPINLSFTSTEERMIESEEIDLKLNSENFNLSALGNTIPQIQNQKGLFTADIQLKGTLNDPNYFGEIILEDGYFLLLTNNMIYTSSGKITLDNDIITIDQFSIKNSGSIPTKGEMNISGEGRLAGFTLENLELQIDGDLAVLSDKSKATQPSMYGDLFLATDGNWTFRYSSGSSYFFGSVVLKETDLIVIPLQDNYSQSTNFNYVILEDTTNRDSTRAVFEDIVQQDKVSRTPKENETELKLDYEIDVRIQNSAKLEIVLSQLANQKLIVELSGDLTYEKTGDRTRAQGAFQLMDGSKLEFFKTFIAEGTIRFESDITDPYLNIIATYKSDYTPPNSSTTQEVAVKLKLEGPVSQLGRNLANNPDNISVYTGARDINNNVPDERYDASDAISFILVNKFKEDLNAQSRQEVADQTIGVNTAASFLGSILTGYVNSAVGDVVNNIQIGQSGQYTKFNVSGRFSNFKYTFGGTTELFDDINKANLRVDYLFSPKFLIRLERKDPIVRGFGIEEKITELGIKYRFEF